jgi:hypothetical protein
LSFAALDFGKRDKDGPLFKILSAGQSTAQLPRAVLFGCRPGNWTPGHEARKFPEAEKGGNGPPFCFLYGSWGELHCCAFAELIECPRWLFIMVFADRTQALQTERLEFGFRDTFLFDRPAKSEASKDISIHN